MSALKKSEILADGADALAALDAVGSIEYADGGGSGNVPWYSTYRVRPDHEQTRLSLIEAIESHTADSYIFEPGAGDDAAEGIGVTVRVV